MAYEYGPLSRPLEETLAILQAGLMREYRSEYLPAHRRSARRSRRLRRIRGWCRATGRLAEQAALVARQTLPRIEQDTGHIFRSPDGLARILMTPSTKRLFLEILTGFPEDALPVRANDLALLGRFSEDTWAVAIVGDVTLQLKIPSGLHGEKVDLVALCDRWGLHESLIGNGVRHPPDGGTLVVEKETLARAVLGLIYIEGGADALGRAASLLVYGREG